MAVNLGRMLPRMNPRPAAILVLAVTGAWAQAPPAPGLDPTPLAAEALGLTMYLPAGAIVNTQSTDQAIAYLASDPEGTWSLRVSNLRPAVPEPSAEALAAEHLKAIQATGREHKIIINEPRSVGSTRGQLLYLQQTLDDQKQLVNGWLILPNSPRTFVILTIVTTPQEYPRLRPIFEACFDSIQLRSVQDVRQQREARFASGRAIIGTLTADKLRSTLGGRFLYRIYRQGASRRRADDTEVGFLTIECLEGMRGELTPERSANSFTGLETERGLMVLLEARAIIDAEAQRYLDVDGRYWMAWDRGAEAWSIRQTQRAGAASQTTAETGVRNRATLNVIHSSKEQRTREPAVFTIPDMAYLSQPEIFLLGQLLPRDGSVTGEMTFYFYDSKSRRVAERIDSWERTRDGSGHWVLTSQPMLEATIIKQVFDARGERIRRIDGQGTITERIDPEGLRRIWESKGLLTR